MHADQLALSPSTVCELVGTQFPAWRHLTVEAVKPTGTVNAIFRIGDGLAARFPLRAGDAAPVRQRLESEAAAVRGLAGRTRFATPEPVAIGEPGAGYRLPWAVQTWLPGMTAAEDDPGESVAFAHDLAEFISGVRAIGTGGRGPGVGARPGMGVRAGDGIGLVLRGQQPGHEPDGPPDAGPHSGQHVVTSKSGLVPPVGAFRLASADVWSNLLWLWPVWLVLMSGRAGTPRNPGPGSARSAGSRPSAVPCHPSR